MTTSTLSDGEPVACERCKQLEEQVYDLLGRLQAANLSIATLKQIARLKEMQAQRTWVGLTDMERQMTINKHEGVAWETAIAIEQQLKGKNV